MPKIHYVTKRFRSETHARICEVNAIIEEYLAQGFKLTLRQIYYQMVARALISNTQRSYKQLGGVINDGRLAGLIDWDAIEDRTRAMQCNSHWDDPAEIVQSCARQFRLDTWSDQDAYCEIWVEKEALAGIVEGVCTELDVPYFSCRGYVSQSEMWGAAQRLLQKEEEGKDTFIIHLGDHDPSGIDMTRDIEARLFMFGSDVEVRRIALNWDQIDKYNPPPNPAKATDARFRAYQDRYGDESWELDSLEPRVLVQLIEDEVGVLCDDDRRQARIAEQKEARKQLRDVAKRWEEIV